MIDFTDQVAVVTGAGHPASIFEEVFSVSAQLGVTI
jgi:hypothetical protein